VLGGADPASAQIRLPGSPAPQLPPLRRAPPSEPGPTLANQNDGPGFAIDRFEFVYRDPHPDAPPLTSLLPLRVELQAAESGYVATRDGEEHIRVSVGGADEAPAVYHASAIAAVVRAMLERLHEAGLLGIYVRPDPADIDIESERDLRAEGRGALHVQIWVGRIDTVRTVAAGDRIQSEWKVDNPVHRKIRSYSPLHPAVAGIEGSTDILQRELLEEYVWRLNRHPGRQVEAALAASDDGDGITLDYRVYEPRPWTAYAQVTNTGTERTEPWQTRFGYIHRQLTNHDDILSIEYLNAGGATVNGVMISYDAPWFAPRRPEWMEASGNEPGWIAWADRSRVPWWGLGRLRWNVGGGFNRIATDFIGIEDGGNFAVDEIENRDWNARGGFTYNVLQHDNLFLDLSAGARFRGVHNDNAATGNTGDVTLFQPRIGFESDRVNQYSVFFARFDAEYSTPLGGIRDYENDFFSDLGRSRADPRWWVLHWDAGISQYLEPLLRPSAWRDPTTPGSSTLSHEVSAGFRGQYAFDYRLIPQVSQVIGGQYSVRGFSEGLAVGDNVYLATAEYRFHIPRALPIKRRPTNLPMIGDFRVAPQQVYGRPDWDLVLRLFVDAGKSVRNRRSLGDSESDQTLVGAGVGLEFVYKGNSRARVDWARGVYQNVDCAVEVPGGGGGRDLGCVAAKAGDIDSNGRFYFLFSVMY